MSRLTPALLTAGGVLAVSWFAARLPPTADDPKRSAIRIVAGKGAAEHPPTVTALPGQTATPTAAIAVRRANDAHWDDGGSILDALAVESRSETRDPSWAFPSEAKLRVHLARVAEFGASPPQVRCGTTLCEVVGGLVADSRGDSLLQALGGADMRDALPDAALVGGPALVSSGDGRSCYTLFFKRQPSVM
jgi:hypothetical protein